ncbi:MAG: hypothetical protein ACRC33_18500 [Gemmataceae bacterium]
MNALRCIILLTAVTASAVAQRPIFRPPPPPPPPVFRPPTPPMPPRPPTMPGAYIPPPVTFRLPTPPPRPPIDIARSLTTPGARPDAVFRAIRAGEGRTLPEAMRVQVSRDTVRALATRLDAVRDPVVKLHELRGVRAEAAGLPEGVRQPLERLHEATRRELLIEAIDAVRGPAETGRWADAAGQARGWEGKLAATRPAGEGKDITARHAEVEAACRAVAEVGGKLAALDAFQAAVEGKPTAEGLAAIDPARLPESLRPRHDALRSLAELRDAAARPAPDVSVIKNSLARLERVRADVPDLPRDLGKRVALDLAVKALVEGHPEAALKLMPADAPPEQAAALLRDLKALTLGEGKVETWQGKAAVDGPRPARGVEPLVPEAKRDGWRPPASEKASAGLPLEAAEAAGAKVRDAAGKQAAAERGKLGDASAAARSALGTARAGVTAPEEAERRRYAPLEYRLGRRLTPPERATVRDWLDDGKPVGDVLPRLDGADDEERYLNEVARLLGRDLLPQERFQARKWRRDGRRAAEAAELLRS